jgi:hypothetical protein
MGKEKKDVTREQKTRMYAEFWWENLESGHSED